MSEYKVKINIKNKDLETVAIQEFGLEEFTTEVRDQLVDIIKNIEEAFLFLQEYRPKEEWPMPARNRFEMIRHKMLNQANTVKRLPQNLYHNDVPVNARSFSEVLAEQLNNK